MTSNTNIFGNWWETEIAQEILKKKYFHEGETFEDFINRVSGIFSENIRTQIKQSIIKADFIPAGRSLYGAGSKGKFKATMSNCYIMRMPEDNIEGIFDVAKETARIFSAGGGVGINISTLRPKGAKVNNAARTSTGAVSFLEIFNAVGEVIGAKGRRAALMLALNCDHPDIEDFLTIKQNTDKINSANISIVFTDEFMDAVRNNKDFELKFNIKENGETIRKTINAREFFKKFAEAQWNYAEPGAIFIDRVRKHNLLSGYPESEYRIDVSNPCVSGDTLILTKEGYKPIITLVDKEVEIWNGYEWSIVTPKITGRNQKMKLVKFSNEFQLKCTHYHKFVMQDGTRKEAKDLVIGDKLAEWKLPLTDNGKLTGEYHIYKNVYVTNIEDIPDEPVVYCFNEPKNHTGVFNGIMTGQCAEYYGNSGNACTLASINLYNFVENPFTNEAYFNFEKFIKTVKLGVTALDEILDYGYDMQPLEINKQVIKDWRAIGLGVFGLADMFIALGLKYGSIESIELTERIMRAMLYNALLQSSELAKEKGCFKKYNWGYIKKSDLIKSVCDEKLYNQIEQYGLRNCSLLSVAPTGSIATMCGLSTGVEPIFAISYERTTHSLEKYHKTFKILVKSVSDLLKAKGLSELSNEEIKHKFPFIVEAYDINPIDRVRLQAAMQKYVDNSISSTVNLKEETTVDDIFNLYLEAHKQRCKGLTIFRQNCKRGAILRTDKDKNNQSDEVKFNSITPVKRKDINKVYGCTMVKSTACVPKMYVTINKHQDAIFEVFTNVSQGCTSNIGTISRLCSLALRSGVKVDELIKELKSNYCVACANLKARGEEGISNSCSFAIAEAIEEAYKDSLKVTELYMIDDKDKGLLECPNCGKNTLKPEGKCWTCLSCLYSKCE